MSNGSLALASAVRSGGGRSRGGLVRLEGFRVAVSGGGRGLEAALGTGGGAATGVGWRERLSCDPLVLSQFATRFHPTYKKISGVVGHVRFVGGRNHGGAGVRARGRLGGQRF